MNATPSAHADAISLARSASPARPDRYGSAVAPIRLVSSCAEVISAAAPSTASLRAGPAWADGAASRPSPPAALAADPAHRYRNSREPSCQAGPPAAPVH